MTVDYYSLLTKAVAGKDAVARDRIYKDAFSLITKSHLTREAAASRAAALEDAVRRIEDDIAAEETRAGDAATINEVLSTGRNWKPLAIGAGALAVVIAVSALLYAYVATKGPGIVAAVVTASSPKAPRGREDVVMADLKAGVDGGSSGEGLPFALQRQSGVLPHHRRSRIDRGRSGKPLSLSDRWQQFRAPLRDRDCAGVPEGRQLLSGHEQAEWPDWRPSGANTKDADALLLGRPAVPAVRWARARCCWTSRGCSFTARIRPRPSAISSLPDASGS